METITSSALTAVLLVGLMVLPVASENLSKQEEPSSFERPENNIKSSTVTRGPESFVKEVSTALDDFKVNISGDGSEASLEDGVSRIKTSKEPGKTVRTLKTSEGLYKEVERYDREVTKVSTPRGELKVKIEDGRKTTSFEGVNRSEVERVKASLKQKFQKKLDELNKRDNYTRELDSQENIKGEDEETYSIGLEVQPDTSEGEGEYVEIENNANNSVDMSGWRIEDDSQTSFTFENATLEAEDSIKLYTDYNETEHNWDRGLAVWAESGDTAYLYNRKDNLVEKQSY